MRYRLTSLSNHLTVCVIVDSNMHLASRHNPANQCISQRGDRLKQACYHKLLALTCTRSLPAWSYCSLLSLICPSASFIAASACRCSKLRPSCRSSSVTCRHQTNLLHFVASEWYRYDLLAQSSDNSTSLQTATSVSRLCKLCSSKPAV